MATAAVTQRMYLAQIFTILIITLGAGSLSAQESSTGASNEPPQHSSADGRETAASDPAAHDHLMDIGNNFGYKEFEFLVRDPIYYDRTLIAYSYVGVPHWRFQGGTRFGYYSYDFLRFDLFADFTWYNEYVEVTIGLMGIMGTKKTIPVMPIFSLRAGKLDFVYGAVTLYAPELPLSFYSAYFGIYLRKNWALELGLNSDIDADTDFLPQPFLATRVFFMERFRLTGAVGCYTDEGSAAGVSVSLSFGVLF